GDVVPLVALARELADRGTETLVLAHPEYTGIAHSHGIPCVSLGAGLIENGVDQRWAQRWIGNPVLASLALRAWLRRIAHTLAPVLIEQIRVDDVVVTGVVGVATALTLAEERGCRPVHVTFSATLPTAGPLAMMSAGTKYPRFNRWWTRHGVWAGSIRLGRPLDRVVRRRLRLPRRSSRAVAARALSMPVLVAASATLLPAQPDWPSNTLVTGAWELPVPQRPPDPCLVAWLDAHPRPVYLGFGSMLSPDPAADLRLVDGAARAAGVTVVYRPDDGAPALESTATVRVERDVDHRWLFPRCAAIIHHGGAGTTNTALAAGVPSVIVAHGFDQPLHGARLHQLGVGPKPLPRRALTVESLGQLLWDIARGPDRDGYVESATRVGELVRRDHGVGAAADWLQGRPGKAGGTSEP
ncbi:MAG: glycosyltransferase, partial [Micrococcales bacterium]|nr:glycosyltransferase [Micrococcales bacterium]